MNGSGKRSSLPGTVGWYDPGQLLETARLTVLSLMFGDRADFRLHEAGRGGDQPFDYRAAVDSKGAFWLDYVADLGDGFDATHTVARLLAAPEQLVRGRNGGGNPMLLPRGRVLILGGDEVYPTPDDAAYTRRFLDPYELALPAPDTGPPPHLFAIPGNHDWYDGLGSFLKVFCRKEHIGAWQLPQQRSYFSLRLPHRCWLYGLDTQLFGDIDETQLAYFAGQPIERGDRVIVCVPEPHWVTANLFECSARLPNNLVRMLDHLQTQGATVPLQIAGDLHHYRRHAFAPITRKGGPAAAPSGTEHLVTSGGGGAFLHPTHTLARNVRCKHAGTFGWSRLRCKLSWCRASDEPARCLGVHFGRAPAAGGEAPLYPLAAEYPPARASWSLTAGNLSFPLKNPLFGLVTGILYLVLSWLMPAPADAQWESGLLPGIAHLFTRGITGLFLAPGRLLLVLLVLLGFWAFTDTHRRIFRVAAATAHGATHLALALIVRSLASALALSVLPREWIVSQRLLEWGVVIAGGYVLGAIVMGLYLWIACAVLGRHANEAFSALRLTVHKNFLRLKIDASGITVHALGIERVSRFALRRGEPVEVARGSGVELIDRFFVPAEPPEPLPGRALP
jgi:hypothetical protein